MAWWSNAHAAVGETPSAPIIALDPGSDTGSSSTDNITSDANPAWIVDFITAPVAGDIVRIYKSGVLQASHTITQGDIDALPASFNITYTLSEGSNATTIKHERAALASAASNQITVILDTTASTLSSPTGTSTGDDTADLSVSTNEATQTIWTVVQASATTAPDAAEVIAGLDGIGNPAAFDDSQTVSSTGVKTFSAIDLIPGTAYKAYFVQRDAAGNTSSVSASAEFTTDAAAVRQSQVGDTFFCTTSVGNRESQVGDDFIVET